MAARSNGMKSCDDEADMMKFLSKVDEIGTLIKDMASGDSELERNAFEKADKFLEGDSKTPSSSSCGFDKSVITKCSEANINTRKSDKNNLSFTEESISPDEFLKRIEEDSTKRQRKHASDEREANELKERGNKAYKRGDYDIALKYYSNAINVVKDNTVYYTNRAQAYIKLKMYDEALVDCITAQNLDKNCVKAYVHQGKSLQNLDRFSEAIDCFEKVSKIDNKLKELARGYISEVLERKKGYEKIKEARSLSEKGDQSSMEITETIKKLRREDMPIKQLTTHITRLKHLIKNDIYRTLFRTVYGFRIIHDNPTLARICKSDSNDKHEEQDCVYEIIELLSVVCTNNDENITEMMCPSVLLFVEKFLSSSSTHKVRIATLCFMHTISQSSKGRKFLLEDGNKEGRNILDNLMSLLGHGGDMAVVAVGVINNLALSDKIGKGLLGEFRKTFVPFVAKMMRILCECDQETPLLDSMLKIMPNSLSTIGNLTGNKEFMSSISTNQDIWAFSAKLLTIYESALNEKKKNDTVCSLLGLLMNLASSGPTLSLDIAIKFHDSCIYFLACKFAVIVERSSGFLNRLMSCSPDFIGYVINQKTYKSFISVLLSENEKAKHYIVKCIALCTSQSSELVNGLMAKKAIENLMNLVKSNDETTAGNAALCLGNCAANKDFSASVVKTDIIQDLLHLATSDTFKNIVKHNAAIAIGKLATTNLRHLERLRELHGLEVLHEVMQANK